MVEEAGTADANLEVHALVVSLESECVMVSTVATLAEVRLLEIYSARAALAPQ